MDALDGIADADRHLGRRFPLPRAELPLPRWVDVTAVKSGAVEVAWNLDDSRHGDPGRIALYAGTEPPAGRELQEATLPEPVADGLTHRMAPLREAQPSLRPVHELEWRLEGLYLRLTAQGPWPLRALVAIAQSVS